MLTYMLDTNICIHVMKRYPPELRDKFNTLAEQLCISSITLGELHYGAEKSARRAENLTAIEHFVARLEMLAFGDKAAAHYGQVRAELETANVDEADRADIDAALTEAEQAAVAGDDATCSAIVEQVLAQLPAQ
jgi:predicted nucleic acid-binding protein